GGKDSAYSASTGFTDANLLGINAADPLFFRRSMVCSPVAVDDRFTRYRRDERNNTVVDYYYGKYNGDNHGHNFEDWKSFTQYAYPPNLDSSLAGYILKCEPQISAQLSNMEL